MLHAYFPIRRHTYARRLACSVAVIAAGALVLALGACSGSPAAPSEALHASAAAPLDVTQAADTAVRLPAPGRRAALRRSGPRRAGGVSPDLRDVFSPEVGGEIGIGAPGAGPAPFYRNSIAVASNGDGYLVVWDDPRDLDDTRRILGVRFDAKGARLDAAPIVLARDGAFFDGTASVAYDGTSYVVAWTRDDGTSDTSNDDVVAVRVGQDGKVVDAKPVPILAGAVSEPVVAVRCRLDGACLFVAETVAPDGTTDLEATVARALVPGATVVVSSRPGSQSAPAVAVEASGFLVAFTDLASDSALGDVYGQRLDANAALVGANFAIAATADDEQEPVVQGGTDGRDLVVWVGTAADGLTPSMVDAQLWPTTGTTPSGPVVPLLTDANLSTSGGPSITAVGDEYEVFYSVVGGSVSDVDTALARVSKAGALVGAPASLGVHRWGDPAQAATNGTSELVVGLDPRGEQNVAHAAFVPAGAPDGGAASDTVLTTSALSQRDAVVTASARDYLVTYQELDAEKWTTDLALVSPTGVVTAAGTISGSVGRIARSAADGAGNYLVVTVARSAGQHAIVANRLVDQAGQAPALGATIPIRTEPGTSVYPGFVGVACGATDCLVVWDEDDLSVEDAGVSDGGASGTDFDVYAALVSNAGVVGPPIPLATTAGVDERTPSVGFDGSKYVVLYQRGGSLLARSVASGVAGAELTVHAGSVEPYDGSSVACRGVGDCLVGWTDWSGSPVVDVIRLTDAGPSGSPLVLGAGAMAERPSVVFDGARYLVSWDTLGNTGPTRGDVSLTQVSADATSLGATLPVASSATNEYFAYAASSTPGTALVVYTRMVEDPAVDATRVFGRFVTHADDDAGVDGGGEGGATGDGGADGSTDGGVTPEAGSDAGVPVDAGPGIDGSAAVDAGAPVVAAPPAGPSGCGCHVAGGVPVEGGGASAMLGLAAIALVGARSRRVRRG